jgi:hypothetical protein
VEKLVVLFVRTEPVVLRDIEVSYVVVISVGLLVVRVVGTKTCVNLYVS